jgi:serine/threonine-protein kinase
MQVTSSVRLVRPLGAGGMGAVWIADHLTLNTQVVVKFMSAELALDQPSVARFSREASAAAAVKSPHVVQMFDHGVAPSGAPFIVMELLEGEDLRHRLERVRALGLTEIDAIIAQACKALSRAHAAGIVHRDIKPDNIFLCQNDEGDTFIKLLDFGIAKKGDTTGMGATKTGALMGTPYYMSPEQALGAKGVDFHTDLWSLGVVVFEAMTGTRPFDGETIGALAVAIAHGPVPVPSRVNPALPPAIDAWFARACARDVASRFGSARETADAFHGAISVAPHQVQQPHSSGSTLRVNAPLVAVVASAPGLRTTTSPTSQSEDDAPGVPQSSIMKYIIAGVAVAALTTVGVLFVLRRDSKPLESPVTATTVLPMATPSQTIETPVVSVAATAPVQSAPVFETPRSVGVVAAHNVTRVPVVASSSAKPATTTSAAPIKPDCNPPYTFDKLGTKVYKVECL